MPDTEFTKFRPFGRKRCTQGHNDSTDKMMRSGLNEPGMNEAPDLLRDPALCQVLQSFGTCKLVEMAPNIGKRPPSSLSWFCNDPRIWSGSARVEPCARLTAPGWYIRGVVVILTGEAAVATLGLELALSWGAPLTATVRTAVRSMRDGGPLAGR